MIIYQLRAAEKVMAYNSFKKYAMSIKQILRFNYFRLYL